MALALTLDKPMERVRRVLGISSILTLTLVFLVAVLMALITMYDIGRERTSFYDNLEKRGDFLGNGLTAVFADHLYHARVDELQSAADRVMASLPDIQAIRIFRTDGTVLMDWQGHAGNSAYVVGTAKRPVISDTVDTEKFAHYYTRDSLLVTSPLGINDEVIGSVQFAFDQGPLNAEITKILFERAWQSSALIALGIALAYLISREVTQPLKTLAASAKRIGDGNLEEPVTARGAKETKVLGNALERMRVELRELYGGLEIKVRERTQEISRINQELEALFDVASALARPGSFEKKCRGVLEEFSRISQVERVFLRVPDKLEKGLRLVATAGEQIQEEPPRPLILFEEENTSCWAFQKGQPIVVNDYPSHPSARPRTVAFGVNSLLALPIRLGEETVAVATLTSREPNHFMPERLRLLEAIGDGLGILLENARLSAEIEQRAKEIEVTSEVAQVITSTLDVNHVYEQFAAEVKKLVDFDRVDICVIDSEKGVITVKYLLGPTQPGRRGGDTKLLEGTETQQVMATAQTLIREDIASDPSFPVDQDLLKIGMRSSIIVPLISKDCVIASLSLRSRRLGDYGVREQVILERLASQIAPAVENSYLFKEVQQQALALESIGDAVMFLDCRGDIQFVNRALEEMTGYTANEVLGKPVDIFFPADSAAHARSREILEGAFEGGWRGEVRRERKNGKKFDMDLTINPVRDQEGNVIGIVGAVQDITEQKRAQEELARHAVDLEVSNRELEAFSYSVSHDLRAPLRSINGFSQALLDDCADELGELGRGYLHWVRASSERMAELIDDLLQLSRITRSEMKREEIDLSAIAESIAAEVRVSQPERLVRFVVAPGLVDHGDEHLLRVVLENLMSNSWKFTARQPHGEIEFGAEQCGGVPAYFVRDNGAGFDMAYTGKLFGAFQRLHSASEFEGTGVGLAIVQRVIHRHGGLVWAQGAVGEGATFYFTLQPQEEIGSEWKTNSVGGRQSG